MSDPDPTVKIPAIKLSVDEKKRASLPTLVKDLASDDPAVRFYAIEGLRRLTGETMDYNYYAEAEARQPAIRRWNAWLEQEGPEARR